LTERPLLLIMVRQRDARGAKTDEGVLKRYVGRAAIAVEEWMRGKQLGVEPRGRIRGIPQPSPTTLPTSLVSFFDGLLQSSERSPQARLDIASPAA
jgi:hypothetical protein